MAKKRFALSQEFMNAFDETVSAAINNTGTLHIDVLPLRKIELDPDNPRELMLSIEDLQKDIPDNDPLKEKKNLEKNSLESLAKSIRDQGLINPILVYEFGDKYRLVAGERRTLASIMVGKEDIHAKILPSKPEAFKLSILQWIENIEREDLTLWEKMKNLEKILMAYAANQSKSTDQVTIAELGQLLNCSFQHASNYHAILRGSEELKYEIKQGNIKNIEKAALIARALKSSQPILIKACIEGATYNQLKKMNDGSNVTFERKAQSAPAKKIILGGTRKAVVAKIIFESVIKNEKYLHLKEKVGAIEWTNHDSIKRAFKILVRLLEKSGETI